MPGDDTSSGREGTEATLHEHERNGEPLVGGVLPPDVPAVGQ